MLMVQKLCNPNSVCRVWSKEENDTRIVVGVAAICVCFFLFDGNEISF